jgi:hypothetical protein
VEKFVWTVEEAAPLLGVSAEELHTLCRQGVVTHSDLGAGEDANGVWHLHLIRFTEPMLDAARGQLLDWRREQNVRGV